MILSDIRTYLQQHRHVALRDLMTHFNVDAQTLRGMLDKWIRKGQLQKLPMTASCGTQCCQCDPTLTELYEWLDQPSLSS